MDTPSVPANKAATLAHYQAMAEQATAAAHTPGPWAWDGNTLVPVHRDPALSAVHSILDAESGYGFLGSKPSDSLRELHADRRLIAAAPELLEAAIYALDVLNLDLGKQARLRAIERLQVVIAKATGSAA